MTRSGVFRFKSYKLIDFINQNNKLIILVGVFIISLVCGSLIYSPTSSGFAARLYDSFISLRQKEDFFGLLLSVFWSYLPFQLAAFLCGTSLIGAVLVPVSSVAKGLHLGLLTAYIYSNFGLSGIAFNGLIIMPAAVVSVLSLMLSSKEALGFSVRLMRKMLNDNEGTSVSLLFRDYAVKGLLYLILLLLAALIDAVCSSVFLGMF